MNSFLGIPSSIPNPYVPLSFEEFGGEGGAPETGLFNQGNVSIELNTYRQWLGLEGRDVGAGPEIMAATQKALQAHGYPSDSEAVALARAALQAS
jgi:hypothetical protein